MTAAMKRGTYGSGEVTTITIAPTQSTSFSHAGTYRRGLDSAASSSMCLSKMVCRGAARRLPEQVVRCRSQYRQKMTTAAPTAACTANSHPCISSEKNAPGPGEPGNDARTLKRSGGRYRPFRAAVHRPRAVNARTAATRTRTTPTRSHAPGLATSASASQTRPRVRLSRLLRGRPASQKSRVSA